MIVCGHMRKSTVLLSALLCAVLIFSISQLSVIRPVWGDVTFGVTATPSIPESPNYLLLNKATLSASGTLSTISFYCLASGNVKVGIYADTSGSPGGLLVGPLTQNSCTLGWNTVSASGSLSAGDYWLGVDTDTTGGVGEVTASSGLMIYKPFSFGSSWPNPAGGSYATYSVRNAIYATVSTGSDFTITANPPTSVTVGAGGTASYTFSIQYSSSLITTVNLAVTSGCPSGVTCAVSPSSVTGSTSVTLTVPTLITTPGGTTTITVTATSTSPSLSHSVQVQLTVNGPGSYPVYVYAGSSRVIVTVSWSGSGIAAIYLTGPGGSPTLTESGAVIYDRVVYVTGSSSPTYIHRVTFTLSPAPTSTQTWTALVSLSGSYTVTIEVNSPSPTT